MATKNIVYAGTEIYLNDDGRNSLVPPAMQLDCHVKNTLPEQTIDANFLMDTKKNEAFFLSQPGIKPF